MSEHIENREFSYQDWGDEEAERKARRWFRHIMPQFPDSYIKRSRKSGKPSLWIPIRPGRNWENGEQLEVLVVFKRMDLGREGFLTFWPGYEIAPDNAAPGRIHQSYESVISYVQDLLVAAGEVE